MSSALFWGEMFRVVYYTYS